MLAATCSTPCLRSPWSALAGGQPRAMAVTPSRRNFSTSVR